MTELKCLELEPRLNRGGLVSASYLAPLSALTQLRSLDLQLFMCCGPLPATILPRLQHLTHLGLFLSASPSSPEGVVGWGAGAAGSPRLRSLILYDARLPPEEATVASLGQLEVLRVLGLCPTPRHLSTLVRSLTALTYLRLGDAYPADSAEEVREPGLNKLDLDWSMQLVSGCRQLARLELLEHAELVSLQLPRGALRQLTYLALEYEDVEDVEELEVHASWASLSSLACLRLTVELRLPNATLAGLRELDVGATLYDLGDDEDPLHCPDLTHLVVSDISLVNRRRGLPPQHMLQQLRRLTVQHYGHGWLRDSGLMGVPSSLAQATSLEVPGGPGELPCLVAVGAGFWRSLQFEGPTTWGLKQKDRSEAVPLSLLKPAVLAGFAKVAPHIRQLDFSNISDELEPLIPQLLEVAARYSLRLERVEQPIVLAGKNACKMAFKAIGTRSALESLVFDPMSPQSGGVPLSYLTPLSALTQLCHLDMCLVGCHGSLPPTILPRLQCLTHLGLHFAAPTKGPPQRVSWGGGALDSARLHVLRLSNAWLPPEEATLASLGQLEELQLLEACLVPTALPTVLHCLSGLTCLELGEKLHIAGSWATLPSLVCLRLAGLAVGGIACPSGSLAGIEVLDMGAFEFDWEHCQLTFPHLTWLAMTESSLHREPPPKRILRRLRHLSLQPSFVRYGRQAGLEHFPRNLSQATSLEVLDLSSCGQVELREVDADALADEEQMKSLKRLAVNVYQEPEVMDFLRKQLPELEIVEVESVLR
ncbi:hypothetical protein N2152v2_003088 [Parachlorella kessleri]